MTKKKPRMPREGSRGFNLLSFLKKSKWVIVSRGVAEDVVVLLGIVFEKKKKIHMGLWSILLIANVWFSKIVQKVYSLKAVG